MTLPVGGFLVAVASPPSFVGGTPFLVGGPPSRDPLFGVSLLELLFSSLTVSFG